VLIYNSKTKTKEEFKPLFQNQVKIYVCGPTVYDEAHLGHARSSIVFDLLRRVLKALKYRVTFVKNFTDIDDKILKKLEQSEQTLEELTEFYIKRYKDDMSAINVLEADKEPKATQSIQTIANFIEALIKKDYAYEIEDGIYFDTSKDSKYLSLSHQTIDENAEARVKENNQKRDQKDFALWKFSKDKELSYKTNFKDGRPGWHIECSAMIKEYLAYEDLEYQIDIHGGGADLLFPHHENEACQSRCESGIELAKYWMHNGFVQIDNQKMSKSLGNSFFLKDALKKYDGEVLRFYLLSSHYRQNFNFNELDMIASKKRLDKIYRLKKKIAVQSGSSVDKEFKKELLDAMSDDMNISKALSVIDEMINSINQTLDTNPKDKALKKTCFSNIEFISEVLGIGSYDATIYFQIGVSEQEKKKIEELIQQRLSAKKEKDFTLSDSIRDTLKGMKISIQDTNEGTLWERQVD